MRLALGVVRRVPELQEVPELTELSSQGKTLDLIDPLCGGVAFGYEDYFFDGTANGVVLANFDQARHGSACDDPLDREGSHGGDVVSDQDPAFVGGKLQYLRVAGSTKSNVLDPDDIEFRKLGANTIQNGGF